MLDLDLRTSIILKAIFKSHAPLVEVWAFGSRVSGRAHVTSDLDLVMRTPGSLDQPIPNVAEIQSAIEDSSVPLLVDLHDWALLPQALQREIEMEHCVFSSPTLSSLSPAVQRTEAHHEQ